MLFLGKGVPIENQYFFQDSFTQFATLIVNVHHIIWYFATGIAIFVSWLLFIIVWEFKLENYAKCYSTLLKNDVVFLEFKEISNNTKVKSFCLSVLIKLHAFVINLTPTEQKGINKDLFEKIYDWNLWRPTNPNKENYKAEAIETSMKFNHGDLIEFLWLLAPCIILVLIAIPSFCILLSLKVEYDPFAHIKIIGNQWYWTYEVTYNNFWNIEMNPEERETHTYDSYMIAEEDLNFGDYRLLEVDYPLDIRVRKMYRCLITANDVLHSWAIPSLGVKMDAVPGRLNQLYLYVLSEGIYYGQCSELCGINHGFMPIVVRVTD